MPDLFLNNLLCVIAATVEIIKIDTDIMNNIVIFFAP